MGPEIVPLLAGAFVVVLVVYLAPRADGLQIMQYLQNCGATNVRVVWVVFLVGRDATYGVTYTR
jgi:hypothetical protein